MDLAFTLEVRQRRMITTAMCWPVVSLSWSLATVFKALLTGRMAAVASPREMGTARLWGADSAGLGGRGDNDVQRHAVAGARVDGAHAGGRGCGRHSEWCENKPLAA